MDSQAAGAGIAESPLEQKQDVQYKLNLSNYNLLEELLPALMTPLLQVLNDPQQNTEIIKEVMVRRILSSHELSRPTTPRGNAPLSVFDPSQFTSNIRGVHQISRSQPIVYNDGRQEDLQEDQGYHGSVTNVSRKHLDIHEGDEDVYLPSSNYHQHYKHGKKYNALDEVGYPNEIDKRYKSNAQYGEIVCKYPNGYRHYLQEKRKRRLIRKRYLAVLAAGILFGTTVALICAIIVWLTMSSDTPSEFMLSGYQSLCLPLLAVGHAIARSLDEYNSLAKDSLSSKFVSINIAQASDWPMNVYLHDSKIITDMHIAGPMHGNKIMALLAHNIMLRKLTLSNICNKLCSETEHKINLKNHIILLPVRQLVLQYFQHSCTKLLRIISDKLIMKELQEFELHSGEIKQADMHYIEKILSRSSNTLQRIAFLNSTFGRDIFFSDTSVTFPSLTSIVFEVGDIVYTGMPSSFCNTFPNLQHFSFGNTSRGWSDILNIRECRGLKSLDFKLTLSSKQTNFSLSFLSQNFPFLQSAEIELEFPTCSEPSINAKDGKGNYVLGRRTLPKSLLENVGIISNCNLTLV